MVTDDAKVTAFPSIAAILLRELRLERGLHQAQLADMCGKTPSAYTKIETGRSPISMDLFFRVCIGLQVSPSAVMATVERYAALFTQNQWAVISGELEFTEDQLLREAQEYYGSPGFRFRFFGMGFHSVLNGPTYNLDGTILVADVFRFMLDPLFKESQLAPVESGFPKNPARI